MVLAVASGGAVGSVARCLSMISVGQEFRAFVAIGVLGGFTTFSSFSLDAAALIQRGDLATAFFYVAGSVLAGLATLFVAIYLVRQVIVA
ncbi:MAG: CrcB family protein [Rhodospirillaceae bacterium]|nr:CrcB family protein [Rhodospirillaceae bacterium]